MAESIVASVDSTCVDTVFFNGDTNDLTVTFQKGGTYTYAGVPAEVAQGLVAAPSKGRYMHAQVLGKFSYRKG
jgi:hypothetical protein